MATTLTENIKIHCNAVQLIASDKEHLETYRFFLLLSSLTKNRSIRNYKSKYQYITLKTGFSDYKIRKYTKKLIELGYGWWDMNTTSFNLKNKYHIASLLNLFDKDTNEEQHGFLKTNIEQLNTLNKLKTIILNLAANKKKFASGRNLLKNKKIDIENKSKGQKALIMETLRENMVTSNINHNLFLKEIKKLFGLETIQGASKLLDTLKKEKLITVNKILTEINTNNKFVNLKNIENNSLKYQRWEGNIYEQTANQIIFKNYIPNNNRIVNFMNKIDSGIKYYTPMKKKKNKDVVVNKQVKGIVFNLETTLKNNFAPIDLKSQLKSKIQKKNSTITEGVDESQYNNVYELANAMNDRLYYLFKEQNSNKYFHKGMIKFSKTFRDKFLNKIIFAKGANNLLLLKKFNRQMNFWFYKLEWFSKEYTLTNWELINTLNLEGDWLMERTSYKNPTEVGSSLYKFIRLQCNKLKGANLKYDTIISNKEYNMNDYNYKYNIIINNTIK